MIFNNKIKLIIVSMLLLVFVTGCSNHVSEDQSKVASLSSEQIKELRKDYPLSEGTPVNVNFKDLTFKEVLDHTDSVIIAEVVKQIPNFTVDLITEAGTPEGMLAEKQKETGVQPYKPEFISFQVNVEEVVAGEDVATTINLFYNSDFKGMEPELKPGMKMVVAIKKGVGPEQADSYSFTRYGTYYVVEGDYVLSAYEGEGKDIKRFNLQTNGKSLENLITEINNLKGK